MTDPTPQPSDWRVKARELTEARDTADAELRRLAREAMQAAYGFHPDSIYSVKLERGGKYPRFRGSFVPQIFVSGDEPSIRLFLALRRHRDDPLGAEHHVPPSALDSAELIAEGVDDVPPVIEL